MIKNKEKYSVAVGISKWFVCYKKLWKLLIDKDLKKKDLCAMAGISSASVTKMGKGGTVNTVVIEKICTALNCDVGDIMEIINDTKDIKGNSRHATDIY